MSPIFFLLFIFITFFNGTTSFLTSLSPIVAKSAVTYSMRLYAYPSKSGQSKVAWNRNRDIRVQRANQDIRQALNSIIHNGYRIKAAVHPEKRLMMLTTVHEVDLTHDLSHARISIAVRGNSVEKRKIFVWLCENIIAVRFALAQDISHWKRIPTLAFFLVDPTEEIMLLEEFEQEEEKDDERENARKAKIRAYKIANKMAVDDDEPGGTDDQYSIDYISEDDVSGIVDTHTEKGLKDGKLFGFDDNDLLE